MITQWIFLKLLIDYNDDKKKYELSMKHYNYKPVYSTIKL